jgi:UrcA family protein
MNILKSIQRSTLSSLAFTSVVCLLGATQASATEPAGTRSVTVNYRDLNLSTIQGATALYQRLTRAARSVCDGPGAGVHAFQEWRSCYQAAMADAVAKVNSPLLTSLYRGPDKDAKDANVTAMLSK